MNSAARARIFPAVVLTLAVVALLKAGNVWVGFSSADAQEGAPVMLVETQTDGGVTARETSSGAPGGIEGVRPPQAAPSEIERRILETLAGRHAALDARQDQLDTREGLLMAAERRLEDRFAAFETERREIEALREKEKASETEDLAALVSAYERMKSKDAARIFDALDEEILVSVASGMRTQALAGVLAEMAPDKARDLTRLLAGRGRAALSTAQANVP